MRNRRRFRPLILLGFLLGIGTGVYLGARPNAAEAEPTRAVVEAYFSPKGGAEKALVSAMNGARKELLVGVYLFTSRDLAEAVKRAHRRGVTVKVLLDGEPDFHLVKGKDLEKAGVPLRRLELGKTGNNQPIKYHNKIAIIDQERVATGSFNWTKQADTDNFENLLILRSKSLAKAYRDAFLRTWERGKD